MQIEAQIYSKTEYTSSFKELLNRPSGFSLMPFPTTASADYNRWLNSSEVQQTHKRNPKPPFTLNYILTSLCFFFEVVNPETLHVCLSVFLCVLIWAVWFLSRLWLFNPKTHLLRFRTYSMFRYLYGLAFL